MIKNERERIVRKNKIHQLLASFCLLSLVFSLASCGGEAKESESQSSLVTEEETDVPTAEKEDILPKKRIAFTFDDEVLVEEGIEGFEVGCAVMGTDELTVGEVDEIELAGGFFDFTEKYTLKTSAIHVPARISKETAGRIKETAKILYRALACTGFARVDLFLTPEGNIYFNEINTIPGFTEHSRYPGMMRAIGYSFGQVLDRLIEDALKQ